MTPFTKHCRQLKYQHVLSQKILLDIIYVLKYLITCLTNILVLAIAPVLFISGDIYNAPLLPEGTIEHSNLAAFVKQLKLLTTIILLFRGITSKKHD